MLKLRENTDYELNDTGSDEQTTPTPTLEEDELEYDDVVAKAFNRGEAPS